MCTSERSLTSTCEATGLGDFALVAARLGRGAGHATHPITCKPSDVILFAVTCLCFVQYVFVTFSASSVCVSVCTMVGRTSSASPTMRVPRGTRGDVKMNRYSHTHTNTKSCVLSDLPCSALPGCLHPVCDDVHFRAKPHKHMRSNRVGRLCFGGCEAGSRRWACNTSNYM